jgi:aminoglycoside 6'-N-acetyltransferase
MPSAAGDPVGQRQTILLFVNEPIRGEVVVLRPLRRSDRARMREMLAQPEVGLWWLGTRGLEGTVDDLFDPTSEESHFAIELDGVVIGQIQYGDENEQDYRHASIDVFLDAAYHGRGLGTDAVRTLARHLIRDRGHHRVTIDPAVANTRAIGVYERVGFRRVGVMRQYERGLDGSWHDGLLMDLLESDQA